MLIRFWERQKPQMLQFDGQKGPKMSRISTKQISPQGKIGPEYEVFQGRKKYPSKKKSTESENWEIASEKKTQKNRSVPKSKTHKKHKKKCIGVPSPWTLSWRGSSSLNEPSKKLVTPFPQRVTPELSATVTQTPWLWNSPGLDKPTSGGGVGWVQTQNKKKERKHSEH